MTTLYTNHVKAEYLYFKVSKNKEIHETIYKIIWELYKPSTMSEAKIKLLIGLLLIELAKTPILLKAIPPIIMKENWFWIP